MTGIGDWRGKTGEGWAAHWQRTDRSFGALTERLLFLAGKRPFRDALDIGCGAGELALALARSHKPAQVTGIDVSPQLVAVARERAQGLSNVMIELADAAAWLPEPGRAPQLLVSRHGVMFFDDPVAAFANLAGSCDPGARLVFSCFRARDENPVFSEVGALLPASGDPADPDAPGPFAFADAARVERILREGGWTDIGIEPFDFAMVVGAGDDPAADAMGYFQAIGPAAAALRELGGPERGAVLGGIRRVVDAHCAQGIVALRAACWIVTASRP